MPAAKNVDIDLAKSRDDHDRGCGKVAPRIDSAPQATDRTASRRLLRAASAIRPARADNLSHLAQAV